MFCTCLQVVVLILPVQGQIPCIEFRHAFARIEHAFIDRFGRADLRTAARTFICDCDELYFTSALLLNLEGMKSNRMEELDGPLIAAVRGKSDGTQTHGHTASQRNTGTA